jgi:hypothetical protein
MVTTEEGIRIGKSKNGPLISQSSESLSNATITKSTHPQKPPQTTSTDERMQIVEINKSRPKETSHSQTDNF